MKVAVTLGAAALLIAAPPTLRAQSKSVDDIVQEAVRLQEERRDTVDNYTVYQSAFGMEMSVRFERQDVDGRSVLVPVSTTSSMGDLPIDQAREQAAYSDPWSTYEKWSASAEVEGETDIDGEAAWVIRVNQFPKDAFAVPETQGGDTFEPRSARMLVGKEHHLIHRFEVEGLVTKGAEQREASIVVTLSDYRAEEGVLHPHTLVVEADGILDDEQASEAQATIDKMKEELDNMPEDQRVLVEALLKEQFAQFEEIVSGGSMTLEIKTTRLEVNTPAPSN